MIVKDDLMFCDLAFLDVCPSSCHFLRVAALEMLVEFDHIVLYIVVKVIEIFDYSVSPSRPGVSSCRAIEKGEARALQLLLCVFFL